jgi:hypothetical protein
MKSFESLWREVGEREEREPGSGLVYRKVRLACNGEIVGLGSVGLLGLKRDASGAEVLEFVCPRCNQRHAAKFHP